MTFLVDTAGIAEIKSLDRGGSNRRSFTVPSK
jgi:hypothetical protein